MAHGFEAPEAVMQVMQVHAISPHVRTVITPGTANSDKCCVCEGAEQPILPICLRGEVTHCAVIIPGVCVCAQALESVLGFLYEYVSYISIVKN